MDRSVVVCDRSGCLLHEAKLAINSRSEDLELAYDYRILEPSSRFMRIIL